MAISSEQQKKLQNEQPGANDLNELKEKADRKEQADLQVSASLGMSEPGIRDGSGNLLLFAKEGSGGILNKESQDQYITTKLNQAIYDGDSINEVVENVIEELLPDQATEDEAMSLRERIIAFFKEYEFLREDIWKLNQVQELQSHKYLVEQSKTYLPIEKLPYTYDGDVVGTKGQARLLDNNIIEVREAAMLSNMVGYSIQVYGVTKKKNPIITVEEYLDSIKQSILESDTGDFNVRLFHSKLRRALNAKFETGQIRLKEDYDEAQKFVKEIFEEVGYPPGDTDDEDVKPKEKPKTLAEKVKRKAKRKRKSKRRTGKHRFGRRSRFMGGRQRVKIRFSKVRSSNRKRRSVV